MVNFAGPQPMRPASEEMLQGLALYVLFFMLDDLVIFGLADFAIQRVLDMRFAGISRAVGGVTLLGLGMGMLLRSA